MSHLIALGNHFRDALHIISENFSLMGSGMFNMRRPADPSEYIRRDYGRLYNDLWSAVGEIEEEEQEARKDQLDMFRE